MSSSSALMDASQTYHIGSGGVAAREIQVHDQATWDALTDEKTFVVKHDSSTGSWSYKGIPLLLKLDSKKADSFTILP